MESEKDGSVKDKFGKEMDRGYTEKDEGEGDQGSRSEGKRERLV